MGAEVGSKFGPGREVCAHKHTLPLPSNSEYAPCIFFKRSDCRRLKGTLLFEKLLEVKLEPRQILRSLDDLGLLSTKSNCVRPRMFTVYSVENSRVI